LSISHFPQANRVEETLRLASRRKLLVEAAEQVAWVLGIALSGFIFILLLGTGLLGWWWVVLLSAVGLGIVALRLHARSLSRYRVAQVLDRKLSLSDALSTAHFLLSGNGAHHGREAARFQLEQATQVAATIRINDAFPFRAKRAWVLCGALAAVCFGLFALRYLVTQSLSLHPSLVAFQMPPAIERLQQSLRPKQDHLEKPLLPRRYAADPTAADSREARDSRNLPSEASEPAGTGDRNGDPTQAQTQTPGKGEKQAPEGKSEARAGNQTSSQGESTGKTEERNDPQSGTQQAASAKEQPANGQNSSPGLMNRMKDALSNMMAKMRSNGAPQQPGQQQRSEQPQDEAKNGQSASAANAAPKPGQGSQQNEQSSENQNAEGQAQGQTSERPQNSQGHSSDQSAQKGSDAQSGVGRQDGDKAIKDAAQLQAMGKLAEIVGKRSANLTGDMTVETPSGKQQLKTAYSQQMGHHSDSGGEINRNEIPMMYQQYVREYMEQARKQQVKSKP